MTFEIIGILSKIFTLNVLTVLPSLIIFVMGLVTVVYTKLLSNSLTRIILISIATFFSILAILSQHYITTFISLETLSGVCFLLVLLSKKLSRKVSIGYFLIHALAGVLMLIAIMMNWSENATFQIAKASSIVSLKEIIMLTSLIINTALFPFLNWYTRTYSRTDSFSLIILSIITTKTSFFILWKIIPGGSLLFDIGLFTLLTAMLLALITQNILKFLLLISIASTGFATMAVSYNGFLITEGILNEIYFQLIWYIASSAFSIGGFLTIYGFITNNECTNNSFSSIKTYFQNNGSSIHFVIPSIIFGLCFASFPFTASYFAKSEITKFFVDETILYLVLKSVTIIFIMFAIKLVTPIFYSVEFFKLDKQGKKLTGILYSFVGILMVLNIASIFFVKTKISIFTISVEFFTFIAYALISGILLIVLDYTLKLTKMKHLIEVLIKFFTTLKIKIFVFFRHLRSRLHVLIDEILYKKKNLKEVLVFSKVSPSASIIFAIFLILLFFVALYE